MGSLVDEIRRLPDEALSRLQYLAPATGCFNRCAFCSQAAGREVWQLTRPGLYALMEGMATVAGERGIRVARGRDAHRPGTVFPYLDNDILSYPYLDDYLSLARDALGARVRISSVGYSAGAPDLVAMHRRIAEQFGEVLDGVRLSLTPYTLGWMDRSGEGTTRRQFVADLSNLLRTYRPVLDALGHGAATAAVELRFAPLIGLCDVSDQVVEGHHVIAAGPHLLISVARQEAPLQTARVSALDDRSQPVFSTAGRAYLHVRGDGLMPDAATVRAALAGTVVAPHERRTVEVYRFANADGPYFAVEPNFAPDGRFTALHLYPRTEQRRRSGYTDAARPFLNTLLAVKARHGLGRRDPFPDASWSDAREVLGLLRAQAAVLNGIDATAARHLKEQVLPLVETYVSALHEAGWPASAVFSREFTIDTGQIVNQGRGMGLFRGLVSRPDEPMTPREERGYGDVSLSSIRGTVWRIAPIPVTPAGHLPVNVRGEKNTTALVPSLRVEELDPRHLRNTDRSTGEPLRSFVLPGADLEHVTLDRGTQRRAFPGLTD
ncbi:hypothetical protein ACFRAO_45020 [Streptomyces sp. NPDC056656]|uniref:hypothetical protein n=1 Tax=Streptomyces sp. NPDC056656 TaxID=3345895 RepID=UPI0036AB0564